MLGCFHGFLCVFALVGQSLDPRQCFALQDSLPVLVHLQLDNDRLGWVDAHIDCSSVGLLSLDALDVNHELLSVHLHYLADLLALEVTTHHLNLVILADGHTAAVVLLAQFFGQRRPSCCASSYWSLVLPRKA